MTILEKVRAALRLKTTAFDGEIEGVIAACILDIQLAGVKLVTPPTPPPATGTAAPGGVVSVALDNPLIERAIILYSKANFGYSEDSEKYQAAYELLKCKLSLAGGYH